MLKKELGALDVFCIAAGAMISSGLFVLPGIAFAKAGPSMILAYAFAGILMIPALLANAELVTAMPKAGGSYFFVERSLGPLAGTVAGFSMWLAISLKSAFAMVGIGALAQAFIPGSSEYTMKLIAAMSCLVFMTLNIVSVKGTGRLQIVLVAGLITILCLYVFKGFTVTEGGQFVPFFAGDFSQVFAVTGMVFVSYGGLTKVVDISEEVKNSNRNIPLGMFSAFVFVNLLYIGVTFVTVGVVEAQSLSGSLTPIVLGGEAMAGKIGGIAIALAAIMAFATTGNAGILAAS
ncbi:MAG: amino acid permease, partial [Planctomycetes bacterium]|nr:amino acid permease [Planctomycetota bacterium]